jgi:hypothetical protein
MKVEAEAPLDAKAALVGGFTLYAGHLDHLIVPCVQEKLAAHAAVAACGTHFSGLPGPHVVAHILFHQRPHRAGLHALAAKNAVGVFQGAVPRSDDLSVRTTVTKTDGIVDLHLITGLNAPAAKNTARKIADDKWIDRLHGITGRRPLEPLTGYLVAVGQVLEPAVAPDRTQRIAAVIFFDAQLKLRPITVIPSADGAIVIAGRKHQAQNLFS